MSIGEWEPSGAVRINLDKLKEYVALAEKADPTDLVGTISPEAIKADKRLMKRQAAEWDAAASLDDVELVSLIRFFTLAEMQLPGWEAGKLSPVIYLVKILKKRDAFDDELRRWIKANTDNRYLPNGAVL